jgi:uncharacterized protein YciI
MTTATEMSGAAATAKPRQYLYVLRLVPRLHDRSAWTDDESATVGRHLDHLKAAAAKGQVILAGRTGRTDEPLERTFGITIFEAPDDASAETFMNSDPALIAGIMTAELHPYSVAVLRTE